MIYTVDNNGKLVPSIAKSGKRYRTKRAKQINTMRSKHDHKFHDFYNSYQWSKKSREIRRNEPLCRACVKECKRGERKFVDIHLATSVDHIKPLKDDYKDRLNNSNLQPLCHEHHSAKSELNL